MIGFTGLGTLAWAANAASEAAGAAWFSSLIRPAALQWAGAFRLSGAGLAVYVVSAVAAWLVWRRVDIAAHRKRLALQLWGWQLMANAVWPSLLFGLHSTKAGLGAAAFSVAAVAATLGTFWPLGRSAAVLLLPRFAWTVFMSYLLFRVWSLNPV